MKRRELIILLGAATLRPLAAPAREVGQMRRIGVLMLLAAEDTVAQARIATFQQSLKQLGWIDGHNLQIDYRWTVGDIDHVRREAAELVALAPDVLLATGSPPVAALQATTRTVPIVFVLVSDPVGAGFVDSLARPGGNATGFANFEYAISAPSFGVELSPIGLRDAGEIERAVGAFAQAANGGLILTASALAPVHRDLVIGLAARYRLPTVYYERYFVSAGGLISYGPDQLDQYRRAAGYVDRILKGEKPADLPVQAPTKYELVLNLKAANALGLSVPQSLLARADKVIE